MTSAKESDLRNRISISRPALAALIFGGGAVLWIVGQGPAAVSAAAQAQAQQAQQGQARSLFTGGNPTRVENKMSTSSLRFPKGSRSNWHSHTNGQLLMVQEGKGLTQERGGQVREVLPNQPWWTPAGIEHWHGAAPDVDLVQLTIYEGSVNWLEPVTDAQYRATGGR
jgi:quercetin dioxygenase-like cupin family protein